MNKRQPESAAFTRNSTHPPLGERGHKTPLSQGAARAETRPNCPPRTWRGGGPSIECSDRAAKRTRLQGTSLIGFVHKTGHGGGGRQNSAFLNKGFLYIIWHLPNKSKPPNAARCPRYGFITQTLILKRDSLQSVPGTPALESALYLFTAKRVYDLHVILLQVGYHLSGSCLPHTVQEPR